MKDYIKNQGKFLINQYKNLNFDINPNFIESIVFLGIF
jgi:hypothetical protein